MKPSRKKPEARSVFDVHGEWTRAPRRRSLKDVFYARNVLNLRPGFGRRHPWISAGIMVIVAASLFWGIQKLSTKAEVSDFFPLTCLGNWQNTANAQGKPETLGGAASSTAFTAANSSVFDPGASSSQIFCGSFIPADYKTQGDIRNIGLTLIWKISSFSSSTGAATLNVTTTTVAATTPPAHMNASTTGAAPATATPAVMTTTTTTIPTTTAPAATTTVRTATGTSENIFLKYFALMFNVAFANTTSTAGMPASTTPLAPTSTGPQTTTPPPAATTSVPSAMVATTATSMTASTSATSSGTGTVIIAPPIIATLSPITTTTATGTGAAGTGTKTLPTNANATTTAPAALFAPPPPPDNNFLKVSYSLEGQTWVELSKVNPDNWQNFTATLPIVSWDNLKKLQIKIEGIPTALRPVPQVYLDGMFVEVHYEIPPPIPLLNNVPVPAAPATLAPTLPAAAPPQVITLPPSEKPVPVGQDSDFQANESPTFDFNLNALPAPSSTAPTSTASSTATSTSFVPSLLDRLAYFFLRVTGINRSATAHAQQAGAKQDELPDANNPVVAHIFGPSGALTNLQPIILVTGSNLRVTLLNPGRSFAPGKYLLKLLMWKSGVVYVAQDDFSWGVLAVNFNKSIYRVGDTANIGFGLLTAQGHTVCNGNIAMDVSSPSGKLSYFSTEDKTILRNPTCGPQTVTNDPDYSAALQAAEPGTYRAAVVARNPDTGSRVAATDSFEVQSAPLFDVERSEATRIYPPATYQATMKIIPAIDYAGTVVESVPAAFRVTTETFSERTFNGDTQTISWQVNLKKGIETDVGYSFQAPNVSPELYKLGPLQVGTWKEARQWQIAADGIVALDAATSTSDVNSTTTLTWTHPGAASPTNYLAVVGVSWIGLGINISSVTFGGTAMTLIASTTIVDQHVSQYGLINPPTGSQTVVVTFSAAVADKIGGSITFTGADQTTGWHNATSTTGLAGTISLTITSAVGEMTASVVEWDIGATTPPTTNQTQQWSLHPGGAGSSINGGGDTAAGAATVTHTWTATVDNNEMVGSSIIAAAGGGGPTVSGVKLNNSAAITLTPNTTTTISATASTTGSPTYATSTIYRSGVTATSSCTASSLNCYQIASSSCSFSGATTTVTCSAPIWYFADATDASSSYAAQNWLATITVSDGTTPNSSTTATGVALNTLLAINITTSSINYGTLLPNTDTGAMNQTTTVANAGNSSTTLQISGTALVNGANIIATSSQHYATSSFTFGGAEQLLSGTATAVSGFLLTSPTTTTAVSSPIFWGVTVPAGNPTGTYNGTSTFTAVFSP